MRLLPAVLLCIASLAAAPCEGPEPPRDAGLRAAVPPAQRGTALEVPFRLVRDQIVLAVRVDGRGPFDMLLDAGTDPSAADAAFAREHDLPRSGYDVTLPGVRVGRLDAGDVEALPSDLSPFLEGSGVAIRGILGYSFLRGRIVQIDYPKRVVRFYSDTSYLAARGAGRRLVLPMRFAAGDRTPRLEVLVDGRRAEVILDTGSSAALVLSPSGIRRLGLEEAARRATPSSARGYGGTSEVGRGVVGRVEIPGFTRVDSVATVFRSRGGAADGALGNAFLRDFVLTLDYVNRRVVLSR